MTHVRLLPTVLIAVAGLFLIKLTHLVANSDMIVGSTTPVFAQEQPADPAAPDAGDPAAAPMPAAGDEPPSLMDGMRVDPNRSSRSELALLERLAKRREELDEREKSIGMREALLKAAEKRLEERVSELKDLEAKIKVATRKRDQQQQEDLSRLVAMYEKMKPKQAAKIFEVLETETLIDLVKIMKPRKVAQIMGEMDTAAAGNLSQAIATGTSIEQDVRNMGDDALPQIGN